MIKSSFYLFSLWVLLMSFQCKVESIYKCDDIRTGILSYNLEIAKPAVDDVLDDMFPAPVADDMIGHQYNLELFKKRLKDDCNYTATIECYACIETFPVLSEVTLNLDSAGISVQRTLDIVTPSDGVMNLRAIHP